MSHIVDTNSDNTNSDISLPQQPTVLMEPLQYHIIGDVYVDILCYIPLCTPGSNQNGPVTAQNTASVLKLDGTDTALTQPITIMAGGSTLNTATYLQYLQSITSASTTCTTSSSSSSSSSISSSLDITVHTVFNSNDYYGSILMQHSKANQITLKNGVSDTCNTGSLDISEDPSVTTTSQTQSPPKKHLKHLSTPHCMVMISSSSFHPSNGNTDNSTSTTTMSSERTFLTHRGCATNNMFINELFPTSSSSLPLNNGGHTNGHRSSVIQPKHYHIAGYYCTPEFWKTNTDTETSALLSFVRNIFTEPIILSNENGSSRSNHSLTSTNTVPKINRSPIILSLVTQYDATQQWDITNLIAILPYMHICIMNELEAQQIYSSNCHDNMERNTNQSIDDVDSVLLEMISFFTEFNASTIYVITQGVKGAIAFRNNKIIAQVCGTVNVTSILAASVGCNHYDDSDDNSRRNDFIIDPTGAGDAFCAGFFHSLWQSIQCTTVHTDIVMCNSKSDSFYLPSNLYWSNAVAIQDALLFGCTVGTCSVLQRGGSTVPTSDPKLVQFVHDQYKKLCSPTKNGMSLHK